MLRNQAYSAEKLEQQLEDNTRRFLSESSRNRFDAPSNTMHISKIFDWYGEDFEKGHQGFTSIKATFAHYAEQLAQGSAEARRRMGEGKYQIDHLDYDWRLNDKRN